MTARKFDIKLEQGASFVMTLIYKDAEGVPIDVTGSDARMQIREAAGGRIFASADIANGRITLAAGGKITVQIPYAETAKVQVQRGVYDLFLISPSGTHAERLIYGDVLINASITR